MVDETEDPYDELRSYESFMAAWDAMLREDPESLMRLVQQSLDAMEREFTRLPQWLELSLLSRKELSDG